MRVPLRRYTPPIARLREDWSRMIARRVRRARREAAGFISKSRISDNSEPWIKDGPKTVAECWEISEQIKALQVKWRPPA